MGEIQEKTINFGLGSYQKREDPRAGTRDLHVRLSTEWVEMIEQNGKGVSAAIIHALASELSGKITPLRARDQALAALDHAKLIIEREDPPRSDYADLIGAVSAARACLMKMHVE